MQFDGYLFLPSRHTRGDNCDQEMSYQFSRILSPVVLRKRKERESMLAGTEVIVASKRSASMALAHAVTEPAPDNRLLAGYMAYEFLTRGTLLGRMLNPSQADAVPAGLAARGAADLERLEPEDELSTKKEIGSYAEVASILKTNGAHIPGIINPTDLARWIQM